MFQRLPSWLLQAITLLALALGTRLWIPVICGLVALLFLWMRKESWKLPKIWAYGAIIPFSLWFLLAPTSSVDRIGVLSLWALWIPAWYFWYLAWLQEENRFMWWSSAMALGLSLGGVGGNSIVISVLWTIVLLIDMRRIAVGDRNPWRMAMFLRWVFVFALFSVAWVFHAQIESVLWKFALRSASTRANQSMMRGFEPNSWLGSFESELASPYEREVAIRIYAEQAVPYLRALTYTEYQSGVWLNVNLNSRRYPIRNMVEYSVFAPETSTTDPTIWIEPKLRDFGFLFLPPGANEIAIVEDSLYTDSRGTWKSPQGKHKGGYFIGAITPEIYAPTSQDLAFSPKLEGLFDSLQQTWNLTAPHEIPLSDLLASLATRFQREFTYGMKLPRVANEDPLRNFFRTRRGYCEYFATASVLLLRKMKIPARYVTGFAYPTQIGNAWVYRRSDAHAWVEVWSGTHWISFDPTPPQFRPPNESWTFWEMGREKFAIAFAKILQVLQYGSWKLLLDHLGAILLGLFSWKLFSVILVVLLAVIGFLRLKRANRAPRAAISSQKKHWIQMLMHAETRLSAQGFPRKSSETVGEWLSRLPDSADPSAIHDLQKYQAERFRKE